ncbi:hypothetical protein [Pseudobdellovibrio exovorus]|uniref:Uncharacterized protein n=1 Tax=Pseudobdellovibrio exovorus JSS TaxID=1184267 RepID=M4VBI0_9BACT|nr:hypothetical protein [Pseudobdellovibrio exovorus]AGH95381.1 hypothetical protein A11Q_1165 [Pseudobdellovibrio exovorus JSS]
MTRFLATITLQEGTNEAAIHDEAYDELDRAIINEDGYPYITAANEKIYALPLDMYEFETDLTAKQLVNVITLACAGIEKKHQLKKTLIVVSEVGEIEFAHLEELQEDDFQPLN